MIKKIKARIKASEFVVSALTLMTGSASAQVIAFLATMVITRLYTPSEFGLFSNFAAIIMILTPILSLSYESAIIIVKKEEEALCIVLFSMAVVTATAFICLIIFSFTKGYLLDILDDNLIQIIPYGFVCVILANASTVLNSYASRFSRSKAIAQSKIFDAVSQYGVVITLGLLGFGVNSMIIGYIVGATMCCLVILKSLAPQFRKSIEYLSIALAKKLAWRHQALPKYFMPSILLNILSKNLLVIIIASLFNLEVAGIIALALRIMQTPTIIIQPISNLVLNKLAKIDSKTKVREIYKSYLIKSMVFALIITFVVMIMPHNTISFIFGHKWESAIIFIKICALWYSLEATTAPLNSIYIKLNRQKEYLILNSLNVLSTLLVAYIASINYKDPTITITLITALRVCSCLVFMGLPLVFLRNARPEKGCPPSF